MQKHKNGWAVKMKGWVYVISNVTFPHLVKVGLGL